MSKPALAVATLILAGCASTAEWRALQIDGSSETAFGESLARLDTELSYSRSQMFALALVDIANTQVQTAVDGSRPAYTEQQLRRDLDGLIVDRLLTAGDNTLGPTPPPTVYMDTSNGFSWPNQ